MEEYKEIERSIITKYRKTIWSKFVKGVKDYELINEGDKVMVCISGGKDSFLLAKCIEELKCHSKIKFDACYVSMNPGYNELNRQKVIDMASKLNIKLEMFETDIFDVANHLNSEHPCYMCARMRRGHLYNKAKELGCNKIALGHHFDDVIETTLLSMLYAGEIKTMLPKLPSDNFPGIELIRPLYLVHEEDIISWSKTNNLNFINCACKFTDSSNDSSSKRLEVKNLIKELKKVNPEVDHNIHKALDNINLNCVLGYKKDKVYHSFLDEYGGNNGKNE